MWNYNTHCDKHTFVDCLVFEEWCIDFARKKWQPDFINFDSAIHNIRNTDETYINFERMNIFNQEDILCILKQ